MYIYYRVTLTVKWQDRSCFFSFIFSVKIKGGPELKVGQLDREHLWLRCEFVIEY